MMIRTLPLIALAFGSMACLPPPALHHDGTFDARLGRTINLGRAKVTPLSVLEDSRCPMEARCVWAGRVRIKVEVREGKARRLAELASDHPLDLADGKLTLEGVMPARSTAKPIRPRDYRFTLTFSGTN